MENNFNANDRLITTRVRLQKENPFFSYLVMNLNLVEKEDVNSCAVDGKGNLYYNSNFINKLSNDELKTLLCHEVLHIALLHLTRLENKNPVLWNVATDIIINNTLINNGFNFSDGLKNGLIPYANRIVFKNIEITSLNEKFAEEIYNILDKEEIIKQLTQKMGFDEHIFSEKDLTDEDKNKIEREWKQKLTEAYTYSKIKGNEPANIQIYIDKILDNKLNWKELLYRYITQELPSDYSYSYPSKRSSAIGIFMPKLMKENIDITIAIDTSGSISKQDLTEFLSEIVAIAKSFERLRLNVIFIDAKIQNHYVLENGNIDEMLNYEIRGGGGTDFKEIYDYTKSRIPNTKLLIFFTDGYATFPKQEEIKTLWILNKNGCANNEIPFGEVIRIE